MFKFISDFVAGGKVSSKKVPSDEEILGNISETNLISDSTKNAYIKKLKQIQEVFFNDEKTLNWILTNPEKIYDGLKDYVGKTKGRFNKSISVHTQRAFLTYPYSIMKLYNRNILENNPDLDKRYSDILKILNEPIVDIYENGNNLEKEKDAYIPYEEVCKVRDTIEKGDLYLLLCMYTMIPPVRSNYDSVRIYMNDEKPEDKNKTNYMLLNEKKQNCKMVLNDYKTSKKNGQIVINIPSDLCEVIFDSLNENPREYLFETKGKPYTATNFNKWANTQLHKIFNKDFSLTSFRHIYITDYVPTLCEEDKEVVSVIMGHSKNMQKGYELKNK